MSIELASRVLGVAISVAGLGAEKNLPDPSRVALDMLGSNNAGHAVVESHPLALADQTSPPTPPVATLTPTYPAKYAQPTFSTPIPKTGTSETGASNGQKDPWYIWGLPIGGLALASVAWWNREKPKVKSQTNSPSKDTGTVHDGNLLLTPDRKARIVTNRQRTEQQRRATSHHNNLNVFSNYIEDLDMSD